MTRLSLALCCAAGALMWGGIFALLSHFGIVSIDWQEVGRWTVMIVLAVFTVGTIWLQVEKDESDLEYEERLREARDGFDDDQQVPPPRAA